MDWKSLLKKIPRRQYLRPKPPSRFEKTLGYVILFIVAGIGIAIAVSSRYYDPNLFRLDPALLSKTAKSENAASAGGEKSASAEDPYSSGASKNPEATPAASTSTSGASSLIPADAAGPDWERKGDLQRFTSDNLYDKVDGREDLYKSFEFHELLAADFMVKGNDKRFIQVELFDMTTPKSAFGVFAAERPAKPTTAKIGREAYTDTNGAFFWKGKFYVRVIGADAEKSTQKAAIDIARAIAEKLPESKDTESLGDPLPTDGRVANSFAITAESAFSQSFFRNVYSARYKAGGAELTGFVMMTDSPDKAASIIEEYRKAMASTGELVKVGDGIHHLEAYGSHYVIFARGKAVGGVMEADDKDAAIKLAKKIADYVQK